MCVLYFLCRNSSWSQQQATSEHVSPIKGVDRGSRLKEPNRGKIKEPEEVDKAAPKINSGATDGGILYR